MCDVCVHCVHTYVHVFVHVCVGMYVVREVQTVMLCFCLHCQAVINPLWTDMLILVTTNVKAQVRYSVYLRTYLY